MKKSNKQTNEIIQNPLNSDITYPINLDGLLEIDGENVSFGYHYFSEKDDSKYSSFWRSGGGINPNYEGTYSGEWIIDVEELPEQYRKYAKEIDRVFNENVDWGCCSGCI